MFKIHMGVPEMEAFWNELQQKIDSGTASKSESRQYKLIGKALVLLSKNPTLIDGRRSKIKARRISLHTCGLSIAVDRLIDLHFEGNALYLANQ